MQKSYQNSNTATTESAAESRPNLRDSDGNSQNWLNVLVRNGKLDDLPTPHDVDLAMAEFASHPERGFPSRVQFAYRTREHDTFHRILHYAVDRLLICTDTKTTYLGDLGGLWFPLDRPRSRRAVAVVRDLAERAANLAAAEARDFVSRGPTNFETEIMLTKYPAWLERQLLATTSENLCREVASRLSGIGSLASILNETGAGRVLQVTSRDLSNYDVHKVLPLEGGGAISLSRDEVLTSDEISYLLLEDRGWAIPEPDFDLLKPVPLEGRVVLGRFKEILDRLAVHMLGTSKAVDSIRVPQSNWGKSTLIELLHEALPGMVGRTSAQVLSGRSQFTPATALMASRGLVLFDEADKAEISTGRFMELADAQLHIERKGEDAFDAERTATAVLVGQGWATVDTSVPGVEQRIQWAFSSDIPSQMSPQERAMILSDVGVRFTRAYLVDRARYHFLNGSDRIDATPQSSKRAVDDFMAAGQSTVVSALRTILEVGKPDDSVANAAIREQLDRFPEVEIPKTRGFERAVHSAFPNASAFSRNGRRGYRGLRLK